MLYREMQKPVYYYALRFCGSHELAEDVLQDTFITVWSKSGSFVPNGNGHAWILTIAKNKAMNAVSPRGIMTSMWPHSLWMGWSMRSRHSGQSQRNKFSEAMGEIDSKYVEKAINYQSKQKRHSWLKWGAVAACLCLVLVAVFIISTLFPTITDNEAQIGAIADNAAFIMVDNRLYKDSGEVFDIPVSVGQDGQITSSCDNVPTENNQSNFGTGYSYQYGENDSIYVLLEDGWHVFKLSGSENINMDNLSEQEKMEIDPNYKPNNPSQDETTTSFATDAALMVYVNDTLYKQSTTQASYAELNEDFVYLGEIESEAINDQSISDGIPNKNFQANHSIVGSKVYQYGDDIVVEINGKYWLYENYADERTKP